MRPVIGSSPFSWRFLQVVASSRLDCRDQHKGRKRGGDLPRLFHALLLLEFSECCWDAIIEGSRQAINVDDCVTDKELQVVNAGYITMAACILPLHPAYCCVHQRIVPLLA
jgi:hypothetical protein